MLTLMLFAALAQTDAPRAGPVPSGVEGPSVGRPSAVELRQTRPMSFQDRSFPRIGILKVALNTGSVLARPFRPEPSDVWVVAPAILGTVLAINTDVASHAAVQRIPDPRIAGQELSYWVSYLGEGWVDVSIFLAFGLLGGRDGQRVCIAGLQALAASGIASRIGKLIFRLERPSYDASRHHFFSRVQADAMPSGHTMAAFATAAVLAREYPRLAIGFYLLATWVGVARVQQSTHWFSDVVVGAALGTLFGWQSWKLTRAYEIDVQPWAANEGAGVVVARRF